MELKSILYWTADKTRTFNEQAPAEDSRAHSHRVGIKKKKKKRHFSAAPSSKVAERKCDCGVLMEIVFAWKLYSPRCQTAPTPPALHIQPLALLAHSALSALAGSLLGSTNGKEQRERKKEREIEGERETVKANLFFCQCQGRKKE